LALLNASPGRWIGTRPSGAQIALVMFVGCVGILATGVQPIVLGALQNAQHVSLAEMGHAATAELLCMGFGASLAAALLVPRRLPLIAVLASLMLTVANAATPLAVGEGVTALRALTGFAGGLLIWLTACMIARSAAPERWAGIYLTLQTLAQFLLAALMTGVLEPRYGEGADFMALAACGGVCALASLGLPHSFVELPKTSRRALTTLPPARGIAALAAYFLLMMFIVSIWVYYDPIARQAGLSSQVSNQAVAVSLAFQVLGGSTAVLVAGRLKWFSVFLVCALVDLAMVALLGLRPGAWLFLADAAVFGFIWIFILPFMVPMLIEADPSRRSAVLAGGVALLGGSLGPSVVAWMISPEDTSAALWLGAACLMLSLGLATFLHFTHEHDAMELHP
jgi:hypothetical protein